MSRNDPQFNLRIPQNLKDQVELAARKNKRSATAEIIDRLEATFMFDAIMEKRTRGDHGYAYLPSWLEFLEGRDEALDALDAGNPVSMDKLSSMIQDAVAKALKNQP